MFVAEPHLARECKWKASKPQTTDGSLHFAVLLEAFPFFSFTRNSGGGGKELGIEPWMYRRIEYAQHWDPFRVPRLVATCSKPLRTLTCMEGLDVWIGKEIGAGERPSVM
jgi:hypothetical protein